MGNAHKAHGNLDAAIDSYKQAIKINPNFAVSFYNIGITLEDMGDLIAAIDSYKLAIKFKPNYADSYNNMGNALAENGDLGAAIESFKQALRIKPNFAEAYYNIGNALRGVAFSKPNPEVQSIITSILEYKTFVRPIDISLSAISLLRFEPSILKLFEKHSSGQLVQSLKEIISDLSQLPLLLKFMSVCPLADLELEITFTDIRSALLSSFSAGTFSSETLYF
jgi:tetratricopeptide (TPR) repeat protein